MLYCKAYFNFNRSLTGGHVIKIFKRDNRIFSDFIVQVDEPFETIPDEQYQVVNGEETDNFYPISTLKLRVIS